MTTNPDVAAAVKLHTAGKFAEAEHAYTTLIARGDAPATVYGNLAVLYVAAGRLDESVAHLQKALQLDPGLSDARHNLALILQQQGRTENAIAAFRETVARDPARAEAHYHLGLALALREDIPPFEAIESFRRAVELTPDHHFAVHNLGVALHKSGQTDDAIVCFERAIALKPDYAPAYYHLSMAQYDAGRRDKAIAALRRVLGVNPHDGAAHANLGALLNESGAIWEAIESFRAAVACNPDDVANHAQLAEALRRQGDLGAAAASCEKALALEPRHAAAHMTRALIARERGKFDDAVTELREALTYAPDDYVIHNALGAVLGDQGRIAEAVEVMEQAITLNPSDGATRSNLIYTLSTTQFHAPEEILRITREFEGAVGARPPARGRAVDRTGKIRVGFISAEIGAHAVSYFLETYLRHYDRARIDVTLFPTITRTESRAAMLLALADDVVDLTNVDDAESQARIAAKNIDILIDTTSHMGHSRLKLLAQRCAPIQCHWIGFNGSTGVAAIDCFIGDNEVTPPEFQSHYSEKLIRLPGIWMAYTPPADAPAPEALSPPYQLTLGCFNNLAKVREETLEIWGQVLSALPQARLLLKDRMCSDAYTRHRISSALERAGVARERIEFIDRVPSWHDHMRLYNRIDIALDTLPLNSGTTGFDALSMSTPLVAIRGNWMGARMSSAMLKAMGRPEWIASDGREYAAIVRDLAADLPRLKHYKQTLRGEFLASLLCDGKALAAHVEAAFAAMIDAHNAAR